MADYEKGYYSMADGNSNYSIDERAYVAKYITDHASQIQSVVEVGCGTGTVLDHIPNTVQYTGVDVSEFAIKEANKKYGGISRPSPASFVVGSSDCLPLATGSCDVAFALFSLEHVDKPKEMLDEMTRTLRSGGLMMLLAPNLEFPCAKPNGIRHRSALYRSWFKLLRVGDYVLRIFGIFTFRTIAQNYTQATGEYEKPDDDLTYLASTYEVVTYLKRKGMTVEYVKKMKPGSRGKLRQLITKLPAMQYYGDVMFAIMKKP